MIPKILSRAICCLGMAMACPNAIAGFNAIHVFGDGVSNTNNPPTQGGPANYYGNRYCNGRVFVEVLCEWQGVTFVAANNVSNFGNDSAKLITYAQNLVAPPNAAESLFIIWSNDADFVNFTGDISSPYGAMEPWNTRISQSIQNHVTAVDLLYGKGVRRILMPNAVDVMRTPIYNAFNSADRLFVRQRIRGTAANGYQDGYNEQFKTAMTGLMASKPGLEIIIPDTFAFFDQVLANPAAYGLVNYEDLNAGGIDSGDPNLNGAGAQYVFWDDYHPTAKFQMHLAAFFQQIISPVKVNSLTLSGSNVHMQVANIPLGRDGMILGSANLQPPWAQDAVIDEDVNATQSFVFPANGPKRFYRVAFPVVWTWP